MIDYERAFKRRSCHFKESVGRPGVSAEEYCVDSQISCLISRKSYVLICSKRKKYNVRVSFFYLSELCSEIGISALAAFLSYYRSALCLKGFYKELGESLRIVACHVIKYSRFLGAQLISRIACSYRSLIRVSKANTEIVRIKAAVFVYGNLNVRRYGSYIRNFSVVKSSLDGYSGSRGIRS